MERTASQPRVLRQLFNRLKPGRVEVTGGFLLLTAWLNYLDAQGVVPLALLSCALHEMGHLLAIRMLGGRVRRISITAVGAEMELDRALSYGNECLAALGKPADALGKADRLKLVAMLEQKNAFSYRKSVPFVSRRLGVSRYTVYKYLDELARKDGEES